MTDLQRLVDLMPLAVSLDIRLDAADADEVRGHLAWTPSTNTAGGIMHGGAVMTLADSVGAVCAHLNLTIEARTATIESKSNFFSALREGHLHAISRPLHVGSTIITVQTELLDDTGRRIAHTTQTQAVLSA